MNTDETTSSSPPVHQISTGSVHAGLLPALASVVSNAAVVSPTVIAAANAITDYVMVETPLHPADLGFVFGTGHHCENIAQRAAALWQAGMFPRLMITGGATTRHGCAEAQLLHKLTVDFGVPPKCIAVETHSTNTGENVRYSLPIIDEWIGLKNVRSVLAVGKVFVARRCLMTLQRHWPAVIKMIACVNYFSAPRERWFDDPDLKKRILLECRKIPEYLASGFLVELQNIGEQQPLPLPPALPIRAA